jgi:DNA invertase Pin-like site-specific DNA recombinase
MTVAIYARVSTEDQQTGMQLTELKAFAQRMGWEAVEYVEKISSMKTRPVFNQMMADARLHKFDQVLVWKIDRFSRSMKQFVDTVLELDQAGVALRSITQNVSTDQRDPMGKFVLGLFALLAELERSIIVERVKAGVKEYSRAYAAGQIGKQRHTRSKKDKANGRPRKIFRRDEARELRAGGMSWRAIAAKLGVDMSTIRRAVV